MEDNKLFVFERKEVVLIFSFVIVIAITAFILGVRTGKSLSLKEDGYTNQDIERINLKSVAEEDAQKVVEEKESGVYKLSSDEVEEKLRMEMEALSKKEEIEIEDKIVPEEIEVKEAPARVLSGKYTIQLYANQSKDVSSDFADSFRVKGYDVIIREVAIPSKGTWYRVSIGLFDTMDEAKAYLRSESEIFRGEDYLVKRLN